MDEAQLGDEVPRIEALNNQEGGQVDGKDWENTIKLSKSSRVSESCEMVLSGEGDYSSLNTLGGRFEVDYIGRSSSHSESSQVSSASPFCMVGGGNMVEELTMRNLNMEIDGAHSLCGQVQIM